MALSVVVEKTGNVKVAAPGVNVAATYASIEATCSPACPLKGAGCYAQGGHVAMTVRRLDDAATGATPEAAASDEAAQIRALFRGGRVPQDGARGGRDLRLHVSGDARTPIAARTLANAAIDWTARGGGAAWTYTHSWRSVRREIWRGISVLASMERPEDATSARERGYAPALVVERHPENGAAHTLPGSSVRWIPCPEQTRGVPCSSCRLCLDADALYARNAGIAFAAHGPGAKRAKLALTVVR